MRNVLLSLVVVAVLMAGTIGGTFATWSDSETSHDNYIETGSVDLMVNGADDEPWGTGVPTKVQIDCMIPCKVYGPYPVDVWNASQDCMPPSELFLHIKELCCANVPPKAGSGYPAPITGDLKPEPELVAEYGGKVDCTDVPGVGVIGDDCTLPEHIYVWIVLENDTPPVVGQTAPVGTVWEGKLNLIEDVEQYLGDLEPCNEVTLYFWFHLQQPSEEDFGYNFFPNPGEAGHDKMEWAKFNDWPSWALMKDRVGFNMEFDLWLVDP